MSKLYEIETNSADEYSAENVILSIPPQNLQQLMQNSKTTSNLVNMDKVGHMMDSIVNQPAAKINLIYDIGSWSNNMTIYY